MDVFVLQERVTGDDGAGIIGVYRTLTDAQAAKPGLWFEFYGSWKSVSDAVYVIDQFQLL